MGVPSHAQSRATHEIPDLHSLPKMDWMGNTLLTPDSIDTAMLCSYATEKFVAVFSKPCFGFGYQFFRYGLFSCIRIELVISLNFIYTKIGSLCQTFMFKNIKCYGSKNFHGSSYHGIHFISPIFY